MAGNRSCSSSIRDAERCGEGTDALRLTKPDPEQVAFEAEGTVDRVELGVQMTQPAGDLGMLGDPQPPLGCPDAKLRLLLLQVADLPVDPRSLWSRELLEARPDLVESCIGLLDLALGGTDVTAAGRQAVGSPDSLLSRSFGGLDLSGESTDLGTLPLSGASTEIGERLALRDDLGAVPMQLPDRVGRDGRGQCVSFGSEAGLA